MESLPEKEKEPRSSCTEGWCLELRVEGLRFGFVLGFRVWGISVQGLGFGASIRVPGSGFMRLEAAVSRS